MKRGWKIEKLDKILSDLIDGKPLPKKYRDHALKGNWIDHRECHVMPDWLLIYKLEDIPDTLTELIIFVRTGTHSDLF